MHSYFIPEDGDSELQPNVFLAPKPRQQGYPPTLGQIKNSFPLPGRFHFRFKAPITPGADRDKGSMPVWMDCIDDSATVPTWKNAVVAKVTRIGVEDEDDDDDDDDADFHRPRSSVPAAPTPTTAQKQQQQQQQQQQQYQQQQQQQQQTPSAHQPVAAVQRHQSHSSAAAQPSINIFDDPSPPVAASASRGSHSAQPLSAHSSTGDLFDTAAGLSSSPSSGNHHHGMGGGDDLLGDMGAAFGGLGVGGGGGGGTHGSSLSSMGVGGVGGGSIGHGSSHADFLGMTTSPPMGGNSNQHQTQRQGSFGAQQQQNQIPRAPSSGNSFDGFSAQHNQGPFGDLGTPWK
jgi:DIX domain